LFSGHVAYSNMALLIRNILYIVIHPAVSINNAGQLAWITTYINDINRQGIVSNMDKWIRADKEEGLVVCAHLLYRC